MIHGLHAEFLLHISSQLLFSWRKNWNTSWTVFEAWQKILFALGYLLQKLLYTEIQETDHKTYVDRDKIFASSKILRRVEKRKKWIKIFIHEYKVELLLQDIIGKLAKRVKLLEKENNELIAKVSVQA